MTYANMMELIEGARKVNRHDVAVALQAILIQRRVMSTDLDAFDAAPVVDVIADAAIRSVQRPFDPQRIENK